MAQRKWGIDLTQRKMKWIPYGINEKGEEINDTSDVTVVETLNFFIEQYYIKYSYSKTDPTDKLIELLNIN